VALPTFLVVGAAKGGTTSVYEYLRQHPDVFMPALKEPNFFALGEQPPRFGGPDGDVFNRDSIHRREDYEGLFAGSEGAQARGEASPRYLWVEGTARRIRTMLPSAKIVALLRQPGARAFSEFAMRRRDGWEPCARLEQAIEDEPRRLAENWGSGIYLRPGFYGEQLDSYYREFPSAQIRVYLYEDLRNDPEGLLADLFRFLEVDDGFRPDMSRSFNQSGVIRNPVLRFIWTETHALQKMVRPVLPKAGRQRISRFFIGLEKEPLAFPDEVRGRLTDLYRQDILRLQDLIGRDLEGWLET